MNTEFKNPKEWAYKTTKNVMVHLDSGIVLLKAGALFIYDPNTNEYIHTFSKHDIPELEGVIAKMHTVTIGRDEKHDAWLAKNFKEVPCPLKLQIERKLDPRFNRPLFNVVGEVYGASHHAFKSDKWPEMGSGDISRKLFKFGEKAVFVQNWPEGRITPIESIHKDKKSSKYPFLSDVIPKYRIGEEYPTLGSTEIKVLLIDSEGKLDLIPFFAVQNTGKIAHWFAFRWWLKIFLTDHGITKSHGRFASGFSHYAEKPKPIKDPTRNYRVGELLKLTQPFPWSDVPGAYARGEVYPTLGVFRAKDKIPVMDEDGKLRYTPQGISLAEPRALIVNKHKKLDLIPLNYVVSTGQYSIVFIIEFYAKIWWDKINRYL